MPLLLPHLPLGNLGDTGSHWCAFLSQAGTQAPSWHLCLQFLLIPSENEVRLQHADPIKLLLCTRRRLFPAAPPSTHRALSRCPGFLAPSSPHPPSFPLELDLTVSLIFLGKKLELKWMQKKKRVQRNLCNLFCIIALKIF